MTKKHSLAVLAIAFLFLSQAVFAKEAVAKLFFTEEEEDNEWEKAFSDLFGQDFVVQEIQINDYQFIVHKSALLAAGMILVVYLLYQWL